MLSSKDIKLTKAVVLGRFQPLHAGHICLIQSALAKFDRVLLVIGSANEVCSLKNPFSYEMRKEMVLMHWRKEYTEGRLIIDSLEDTLYQRELWHKNFMAVIQKNIGLDGTVFYTYGKDRRTTEYINGVRMPKENYIPLDETISATDIRKDYFNHIPVMNIPNVSMGVSMLLHDWKRKPEYEELCTELDFVKEYNRSWASTPFPPVFVAVDALVSWRDNWKRDHILVIRRKSEVGNNKLAMPGGYLDTKDTVYESAVRELREETGLEVDASFVLDKVELIDDPARSMRGRMLTHVHRWRCFNNTKPEVKGADDAKEAFWLPLDEVYKNKTNFFSDHYYIISKFFPEIEELK